MHIYGFDGTKNGFYAEKRKGTMPASRLPPAFPEIFRLQKKEPF